MNNTEDAGQKTGDDSRIDHEQTHSCVLCSDPITDRDDPEALLCAGCDHYTTTAADMIRSNTPGRKPEGALEVIGND